MLEGFARHVLQGDGHLSAIVFRTRIVPCWFPMQTWEYKVFASHLDPAELVVLLDQSGGDGWELVTVVAITDHLPLDVVEPLASDQAPRTEGISELIPMQAFRYVFKRPTTAP
jgi:hypothetical protein